MVYIVLLISTEIFVLLLSMFLQVLFAPWTICLDTCPPPNIVKSSLTILMYMFLVLGPVIATFLFYKQSKSSIKTVPLPDNMHSLEEMAAMTKQQNQIAPGGSTDNN